MLVQPSFNRDLTKLVNLGGGVIFPACLAAKSWDALTWGPSQRLAKVVEVASISGSNAARSRGQCPMATSEELVVQTVASMSEVTTM